VNRVSRRDSGEHAHAPSLQPGRPEQGPEDPSFVGLVEPRVGLFKILITPAQPAPSFR